MNKDERLYIEDFIMGFVDVYGVPSCFDEASTYNPVEEEGYWFVCPNCGEPIYIEDYETVDEIREQCPVCEEFYDEVFND